MLRAARRIARVGGLWQPRPMLRAMSIEADLDVLRADEEATSILSYDDHGFNINGVNMRGSVLVFPRFSLLWDVQRLADVTPESLSLVHMMKPMPELVLLGTGPEMLNVNPMLFGYLSRHGVALEHMASRHAIAAFNTLNGEGRNVAAALLAHHPLTRDEACAYVSGSPYTDPKASRKTKQHRGFIDIDAERLAHDERQLRGHSSSASMRKSAGKKSRD